MSGALASPGLMRIPGKSEAARAGAHLPEATNQRILSELSRARTWMIAWPRPRAISQRLTGKAIIAYWSVYSVPLGYSDGESGFLMPSR